MGCYHSKDRHRNSKNQNQQKPYTNLPEQRPYRAKTTEKPVVKPSGGKTSQTGGAQINGHTQRYPKNSDFSPKQNEPIRQQPVQQSPSANSQTSALAAENFFRPINPKPVDRHHQIRQPQAVERERVAAATPIKIPQASSGASDTDGAAESPASFKGFLTQKDVTMVPSDKSGDWETAQPGRARVKEPVPEYPYRENEDDNFPVAPDVFHQMPSLTPSLVTESEKAEIDAIRNRKKLREFKSAASAASMARSDSDSSNGSRVHKNRQQKDPHRYRPPSGPNGMHRPMSSYDSDSHRHARAPSEPLHHRHPSVGSRSSLSSVRETDSGARPASIASVHSVRSTSSLGDSGQAGTELYEMVGHLGAGSTGVMKIMRDKRSKELVAAKWVQHIQGEALSVQLEREIVNHRRLLHTNIIRFREVFATDEHLVIVMDYASIGPLSERIATGGALPEDVAKVLFRQLIDGVVYCHKQGVVHRNLTLASLLLDGHAAKPLVKISGFAYSKAPDLDSAPKSAVTAPMFLAPEVLLGSQRGDRYDGRSSDVWACGIILFTMVTGKVPFQEETDTGMQMAFKATQRILNCDYKFPKTARLSAELKDLIGKIFVADPRLRIDSYALTDHPWLSGAILPVPKMDPVIISTQTESDISIVMERARKRREARLRAQRARAQTPEHFNEDLLND